MSGALRLDIMTTAEGEISGYDAAITSVPSGWYGTVAGERVFLLQLAGRDLRGMSERLAASIGEKLHHAQWTITSDPGEVTTLGLMHDCAACRAGVGKALAVLQDDPGAEVAVGQLWWAA